MLSQVKQKVKPEKFLELYQNPSTCTDEKMSVLIEILSQPNENAMRIFRLCGFENYVIGVPWVRIHDVAEFYGVNITYARGCLTRHNIVRKNLPEEFAEKLPDCFGDGDFRGNWHSPYGKIWYSPYEPEAYDLKDGYQYGVNPIQKRWRETFRDNGWISVRLALAMAFILEYGRTIPSHSLVGKVRDIVIRTEYYDAAMARIAQNENKAAEQKPEVKVSEPVIEEPAAIVEAPVPTESDQHNRVVMSFSPEFFAAVMTEFMKNQR